MRSLLRWSLPKTSTLAIGLILAMGSGPLFSSPSKGVAKVVKLRGEVSVQEQGKQRELKLNEWVSEGAKIQTQQKSFVRLVMLDKSKLNVGPRSEMLIEKFSDQDASLLNVVKGKVRSQVTKDYLKKDKSKMYVKSPSAVMGIRGTDFTFSYNEKTRSSTAVLFSGEVVFSKVDENISYDKMENVLNKNGVSIRPGEFSVASARSAYATIPAVMNIKQRSAMEKNQTFSEVTPKAESSRSQSVVPRGLKGDVVSAKKDSLSQSFASSEEAQKDAKQRRPDGRVTRRGQIKPVNGSLVDIDTGAVLPPSEQSVYDANTNSYIDPAANELIKGENGFLLPDNMKINEDGNLLINEDGRERVIELDATKPSSESIIQGSQYQDRSKGPDETSFLAPREEQRDASALNPLDPNDQQVGMEADDAALRDDPTNIGLNVDDGSATRIESDTSRVNIDVTHDGGQSTGGE